MSVRGVRIGVFAGALVVLSAHGAWAERPQAALGTFRVTVFLPESTGETDPDQEDWTEPMAAEVVRGVDEACSYWVRQAPEWAGMACEVGYVSYADTPTQYEPILRDAGVPLYGFWGGDEDLWINEMMDAMGTSSIWLAYDSEVEEWNDLQRVEHGTDAAFSVFVANSLVDADGLFPTGEAAYVPELRAPYAVLTWDNGGWREAWGERSVAFVAAHEMGHIFGAHDEYAEAPASDCSSTSNGYRNENHAGCPGGTQTSCLMHQGDVCALMTDVSLCYWTQGMVGWEPRCAPYGDCDAQGPWECAGTYQCVDASVRCDGVRDCGDGSDEDGCSPCAPFEVVCPDGSCAASTSACPCQDEDGDGSLPCGSPADCDDHDPSIHPRAVDLCEDGVDQDCSGADRTCDEGGHPPPPGPGPDPEDRVAEEPWGPEPEPVAPSDPVGTTDAGAPSHPVSGPGVGCLVASGGSARTKGPLFAFVAALFALCRRRRR